MARERLVSTVSSASEKSPSIRRRGPRKHRTRGRLEGLSSSSAREKVCLPLFRQVVQADDSGLPVRNAQWPGQGRSKQYAAAFRHHRTFGTLAMKSDPRNTCVPQARRCQYAGEATTAARICPGRSPEGMVEVCRLPPVCQGGPLVRASAVAAVSNPTGLPP